MSKGFDTNAPKELLERCCHEGSHLGKGMLSSALQTVGGNTALALLLTVSSNLLGIFTMPFILCQLLGASGSAVTMKPGPLLANLLKTILAPLLAGAAIRSSFPGEYSHSLPAYA